MFTWGILTLLKSRKPLSICDGVSQALVLAKCGQGKSREVTYCVEAELGPNVSNMDIRQRQMCLEVPDGHDEGMWTKCLAVHDQLRHDSGIVRHLAQRSDPPFRCSQRRRVQNERLVLWVPRCRGLEASDIGAVTKLSLRIASNDLELLCSLQEELVLLWCALLSDGGHEHLVVHRQGRGLACELDGIFKLLLGPFVLVDELLEALSAG